MVSAMRGRGASRFTRKSSAMWRRSIVTRIMPIITIQIMPKTSKDGDMTKSSLRFATLVFALLAGLNCAAVAQDRLRIAGGLAGAGENCFSELGQNAGLVKKHGLVLDVFYTQAPGETKAAVIRRHAATR